MPKQHPRQTGVCSVAQVCFCIYIYRHTCTMVHVVGNGKTLSTSLLYLEWCVIARANAPKQDVHVEVDVGGIPSSKERAQHERVGQRGLGL